MYINLILLTIINFSGYNYYNNILNSHHELI